MEDDQPVVNPIICRRRPPTAPAVSARIRTWVRAQLDLGDDVPVTVSVVACGDTSCAPVETVIGVLVPGAPRSVSIPGDAAQLCPDDVARALHAR